MGQPKLRRCSTPAVCTCNEPACSGCIVTPTMTTTGCSFGCPIAFYGQVANVYYYYFLCCPGGSSYVFSSSATAISGLPMNCSDTSHCIQLASRSPLMQSKPRVLGFPVESIDGFRLSMDFENGADPLPVDTPAPE